MKTKAVTYIGFAQDHSGSMIMNKKHELAMTNFNEQRAKILKEDDKTMDNMVSIIEFDDEIYCNIDNEPISKIQEMKNWWTGGMTSLYDAIGFCIENIKEKMDEDEREDKAALIIIQTDGEENNSKKYAGEKGRIKIKEMINKLENTNKWSFVFLGENIDKEVAMDMGFKLGNIMSHKNNFEDVKAAYTVATDSLDSYMKSRKRGVTQTMSFYRDRNPEGL